MDDLYEQSLIEDLEGFLKDTDEEDLYATSQELGLYDKFPKERRTTGRRIKQLWAKHADHEFFKQAVYGHTAGFDKMAQLVSNPKSNAEISARIGNNLDDVFPPLDDAGYVVAIVSGRTTLASNNMDCIYSGPYLEQTPEAWSTNRKCSGFSKYPGRFTRIDAASYILSADDLVSSEKVKTAGRIHDIRGGMSSIGNSEALLDNWHIKGIYFNNPGQSDSSFYYDSENFIDEAVYGSYLFYLGKIIKLLHQCYLKKVPVLVKDFATSKMLKVVDESGNVDEKFLMSLFYHADEVEVPTEFYEIWRKMKTMEDNSITEGDLYSEISEGLLEAIDSVLDEKKRKKRKKKGGKKDACYHKVRARYDVWPSAYASGALVKCRKVGAANWGNKSKKKNEGRQSLKQTIKEELKLYLEGQAEDLTEQFPELQPAYDAGIRNPQYLRWIQKRRGGEPVEDVVDVVKRFNAVKGRLKQAGKSPDIYSYQTAAILRQVIEDLGASKTSEIEREKKRVKREELTYFGNYGDWAVFMPHTTQASIQLGKGTTWCTAATESQNHFLSHTAKPSSTAILYYIVKRGADSRADPTAKLCIGYDRGKIVIPTTRGGLTVTADNDGLTMDKLSEILGDQLEPILNVTEESAASIGNNHPAKKIIKNAAKDLVTFQRMTAGLNEARKAEQISFLFKFYPKFLSQEVIDVLTSIQTNLDIRKKLAENPSMPPETLLKLANDKNEAVRKLVAYNPSTPPETLARLTEDEDTDVKQAVAKNPLTPPESLANLVNDYNHMVRITIASRKDLPPESLIKLANDSVPLVRHYVAANHSTPPKILAKLGEDENAYVKEGVAKNPLTPPEILAKLAEEGVTRVRYFVASNPSSTPETLNVLSRKATDEMRRILSRNPSTPTNILTRYARSKNNNVRANVAKNPNTPIEVLGKILNDKERYIPQIIQNMFINPSTPSQFYKDFIERKVAKHVRNKDERERILSFMSKSKTTPLDVLEILANYRSLPGYVELQARKNIAARQEANAALEEKRKYIKQVIKEELKAVLAEKKKRKKAGSESSKESNLRDWFKRKGAPGKKGGWVDCNTCRKGKCKPCGRSGGEKRSKYPSCRPTPAACKERGRGKSWGKRSSKKKE